MTESKAQNLDGLIETMDAFIGNKLRARDRASCWKKVIQQFDEDWSRNATECPTCQQPPVSRCEKTCKTCGGRAPSGDHGWVIHGFRAFKCSNDHFWFPDSRNVYTKAPEDRKKWETFHNQTQCVRYYELVLEKVATELPLLQAQLKQFKAQISKKRKLTGS